MDFGFDPSEAVMVQAVTLEEQDEDDPQAAPFVDENPCLLCGHKAFANFINLSYGTSCTSTTVTPVKKKLRDILGKIWSCKIENQTLCLACYDLVDRFDSLESQLKTIRENISDKFCRTNFKANGKSKPSSPGKKKKPGPRCKKGQKRSKSDVESDIEGNDNEANTYTVEIYQDGNDPDYTGHNESLEDNENKDIGLGAPQFQLLEMAEEPPNPNVYDEHHQLLQRGEKIRLGAQHMTDNGVTAYRCAYCPQIWDHITSLHSHVHTVHQPEVVDVAIPAELGMGNTMNCGVEVQNCQEPPENPKPWSCLFCDSAFRARTNMSSHFKEKHTPHKPFLCNDCGEAFRKGIDLNRHKLYFCPSRTVTFAPKRKYKKRDAKEKSPKLKIKLEDKSEVKMTTIDIAVT